MKLRFYVAFEHFLRPFVARRDSFASLCGPQALFSSKMWPANIVEFETPALVFGGLELFHQKKLNFL